MIIAESHGDVTVLSIDREERRNALDTEHCVRLQAALEEAVASGARVIVLTGRGSSFCAGADFGEVYADGFRDALYSTLRAMRQAPVPLIAAINGPAIGAGTQLAVACDLRVAITDAKFALPTARLGLAVDPWTVQRLGLLAGGVAARLLLGCETISAEEAREQGLVDRIDSSDAALAMAQELATFAPLTLRYNKLALNRLYEPASDPDLLAAFEACWTSQDIEEGRQARLAKRPPVFRGK